MELATALHSAQGPKKRVVEEPREEELPVKHNATLSSQRCRSYVVWLLVFLSWVCHRWRTLRLKPSMVAPSATSSK